MAENVKRKKKKRAVLIVLMALVLAVLAVVCVYETELNKLDSNDGVDNSFYDSQFKNKKVMVIVPHEDDDLLISGQRCFRLCTKTAPMSVSCSQQTAIKEFLHIPVRVKPVMRLKNSVYRERK